MYNDNEYVGRYSMARFAMAYIGLGVSVSGILYLGVLVDRLVNGAGGETCALSLNLLVLGILLCSIGVISSCRMLEEELSDV